MTPETTRQRAASDPDIVENDDGFYVFWPEGRGFFEAHQLRALADEIDRRNAPWEARIEAYFSGGGA